MHKQQILITSLDDQIALSIAYASYHQAMAITGAAKEKKLFHGTGGPEFTDAEKISDSMDTALTHLKQVSELMDKKQMALNYF